MKPLLDLFPGIVFFITYFTTKNFMLATYALVISSAAQIALHWLVTKQFEKMQVAVFLMLLPLASLTLIFHNEQFLKWKPSIVNWIFAGILWGSYYLRKKNLSKAALLSIFSKLPEIPLEKIADPVWNKINHNVAFFLTLEGIANIWVAYHFSTATWVSFKVIGLLVMNLGGMIWLSIYLLLQGKKIDTTKSVSEKI